MSRNSFKHGFIHAPIMLAILALGIVSAVALVKNGTKFFNRAQVSFDSLIYTDTVTSEGMTYENYQETSNYDTPGEIPSGLPQTDELPVEPQQPTNTPPDDVSPYPMPVLPGNPSIEVPPEPPSVGPSGIACTLEALMCPDGSAVGRIPPNCDFAPCPGPSNEPIPNPDMQDTFPGSEGQIPSPQPGEANVEPQVIRESVPTAGFSQTISVVFSQITARITSLFDWLK